MLIVETEISAAMLLKSMLHEMGVVAVGPAFNLRQAEHLAACCEIDGALLSAHLNGEDPPFSVATTLRVRRIPVILLTNHPLPEVENFPTLQRPFSRAELKAALQAHLGGRMRSYIEVSGISRSEPG